MKIIIPNHFVLSLLVIFVASVMSACQASSNTNTQTQNLRITATRTSTRPPSPSPTPSSTSTAKKPPMIPHLGDNLSAFEKAYGKYTDEYVHAYMWIKKPKDPYFEIIADRPHGNIYEITQHYYVLENPPNQGNVSLQIAQKACEQYKPTDSKLLRKITKPTVLGGAPGIQYIYMSRSLASKLDSDDFINYQLNDQNKFDSVQPGTYTLFYLGSNATGYEQCFLQAGINWPF
ncbi:hypothetical protein [Ktedonospora formicarum]|uniref:Lipoprotein n=1 Tax=Ktedonospora formicarum TaxID=2778364 RepID=A0A8J3MX00_9CHLR|nr:hypothetical protein [Ktedonospora formicarum]GHO50905.1 hypothetical protein KSX_90680 [Ktedonospora formicarum]